MRGVRDCFRTIALRPVSSFCVPTDNDNKKYSIVNDSLRILKPPPQPVSRENATAPRAQGGAISTSAAQAGAAAPPTAAAGAAEKPKASSTAGAEEVSCVVFVPPQLLARCLTCRCIP